MKYEIYPTSKIEKDLKKLAKKYPSVLDIVEEFYEFVEQGHLVGSEISGLKLGKDKVYKARLDNPDRNQGKSGGFRIVYYLVTNENEIYPLTIYSKTEQSEITNSEIKQLIKSYM